MAVNRIWLALVASLSIAACGSSPHSHPYGMGGTGGGGGNPAGAGGTGGASSAGRGGAGGARECEQYLCKRPFECIRSCGGPIEYAGCCECEAPLFDNFAGMACGDGGTGAISYVGCRYIGGIDHLVVAKRDASRNLCVNVVFGSGQAPAGLTLPIGFGLESASAGPASACPTLGVLATGGGPVTGTVVSTSNPQVVPSTLDVDILVTLPGNDEALNARDVDVTGSCL
jgi:hypothetical protein